MKTGVFDTEHFISGRDELNDFFGSKNYLMETFYRHIRKENGWLMEPGGPEGGRWNYDKENRKALPREIEVIAPKKFPQRFRTNALISDAPIKTIGSIDPEQFI